MASGKKFFYLINFLFLGGGGGGGWEFSEFCKMIFFSFF